MINPSNVLRILKEKYNETANSEINDLEEEVGSYLIDILSQVNDYEQTVVENVSDLIITAPCDKFVPIFDPEADDLEYREDPETAASFAEEVPFSYKKRAIAFWKNDGRPRSFESVLKKFKKIKYRSNRWRWAKQVDAGGTHKSKLKRISKETYEKFIEVKNMKAIIHDLDLRRWAITIAKKVKCDSFKASLHWLKNFKKAHKIVSRKITKFVSTSDIQDREAIENAAIAFQIEQSELIKEIGVTNTYNADQSGFQYELHSNRTLDIRGEKKIERLVQSKNSTTHSYTIMPTMSADGILISPMYIVLQEPSNEFGPIVQDTMIKPENLKISCSKSGKMGKEHLEEWVQDVFIPHANSSNLLIIDSWSTFTEDNIRKGIPDDKQVTIRQIPPGATGMIQPWDVFGFRIWKNYVRHIEDFMLLHRSNIILSQRNNVLKLQSLVFEQLRSPRFKALFQYSWYKSGLVDCRGDRFENPVKFCFGSDKVRCDICDELHMITCSWCKTTLCVIHFF